MKINKKIVFLLFIPIVILLVACLSTGNTYAYYVQPDVFQGATFIPVQNRIVQTYLPIIINRLGEVYYISPNGSDHNPGTLNLPWKTLGKAASMLEPGDIVYIRGGIYQEAVDFKGSGTSKLPIHILAYPGETPIIDGNNYTIPSETGGALLELSGNYIYVSGLEVRYSSYLGVLLSGSHVTANRINCHHSLHGGMNENGDYTIIENSIVWSNDMQNYEGKNPAGDSTGLTAARNPLNAILRNNTVYGNWGIGLSTYEADGTLLENNISYDNYGPNVYISDAQNIIFQNNFIYTTGAMKGGGQIGIQTGDEKFSSANIKIINNIVYRTNHNLYCLRGSSGQMINVLIANNTFVNSTDEAGVEFKVGSYQNVRFMNNIVRQDGPYPVIRLEDDHPGLTFSYNLWSKTPRNSASGPGDLIADPLFTETGDPYSPEWFMLNNNSPAINGALSLPNVTYDYFWNLREPIPDMGAHEFTHP
jgi:hypothetical protein